MDAISVLAKVGQVASHNNVDLTFEHPLDYVLFPLHKSGKSELVTYIQASIREGSRQQWPAVAMCTHTSIEVDRVSSESGWRILHPLV